MGDATDREEPARLPAVLELDHVFDALAHQRRRYLLYALLESDERHLRHLAREVTAWEEDVPPETLTEDEVERTYVSLYHTHVPKLVGSDIVAFDAVKGTISPADTADRVFALLEAVGGVRDSKQGEHARAGYDEGHS